jgi:hypothetical protein
MTEPYSPGASASTPARVKRDVFITLGFCELCELEVAVCAPDSFVFGVLKCPWCGATCTQPSGLPDAGAVASPPTYVRPSPYVAALHWWANVLARVARDGGGVRREPMRRGGK